MCGVVGCSSIGLVLFSTRSSCSCSCSSSSNRTSLTLPHFEHHRAPLLPNNQNVYIYINIYICITALLCSGRRRLQELFAAPDFNKSSPIVRWLTVCCCYYIKKNNFFLLIILCLYYYVRSLSINCSFIDCVFLPGHSGNSYT